jgi:hypothetical protein
MADAPDAPTAVDAAGHHPTRLMVGRTGRGDDIRWASQTAGIDPIRAITVSHPFPEIP